ncbi:MAG: hypothetical protein WD904_11410 [Dehalococcoidia bacterium]
MAIATRSPQSVRLFRDSGSFRDPSGGVLLSGDRVLRFFRPGAEGDFRKALASGALASLEDRGLVVGSRVLDRAANPELYASAVQATGADVALLVEHPRIPFISYPYGWPFEMLRAAAIAQLDVIEAALNKGFAVKDATAYNMQFIGSRPVFIDVASLEPYEQGGQWAGYAQFCRGFLNPLLLQSLRGVPFQPWLRHSLDGIDPAQLSRLLGLKNKLRPGVFVHVVLQAWLNRRFAGGETLKAAARSVSLASTLGLVRGLRKVVERLKRRGGKTTWVDYEANLPYAAAALAAKERFVEQSVAAERPAVLWDLGCNQGLFSMIAARHAGYVVAMDFDEAAVGGLYEKLHGSENVLPLVVDLMNPEPDQGWAQDERRGLAARGPADFALALALVHHLRISGNVPLHRIAQWLSTVTRAGVIEFVPKADPMVQRLLSTRRDVYPDYTQDAFEAALNECFNIEERHQLPESQRVLYRFRCR